MGELLAQAGAVLLCGGLQGAMEAAAEGASRAGGLTVGFLPGDDPSSASPWIRVPVATGLGEGRNLLLVRAAAAVIAVGGSLGTLSEIALALRLGRPVAGLDTWSFSPPAGGATAELGLVPFQDAQTAVAWALAQARVE